MLWCSCALGWRRGGAGALGRGDADVPGGDTSLCYTVVWLGNACASRVLLVTLPPPPLVLHPSLSQT